MNYPWFYKKINLSYNSLADLKSHLNCKNNLLHKLNIFFIHHFLFLLKSWLSLRNTKLEFSAFISKISSTFIFTFFLVLEDFFLELKGHPVYTYMIYKIVCCTICTYSLLSEYKNISNRYIIWFIDNILGSFDRVWNKFNTKLMINIFTTWSSTFYFLIFLDTIPLYLFIYIWFFFQ